MSQVTQILQAMEGGNPQSADSLLPLVYDELRQLAKKKLAFEKPGQTLDATALVHEAFVRLVDDEKSLRWNSRGHFFAAAAEAMRRILIENARRRHRQKHGGEVRRVALEDNAVTDGDHDQRLLELDEVLGKLERRDERKAKLVKLRFFAGLTNEEAALALNISPATAARDWSYSRAWLKREMSAD